MANGDTVVQHLPGGLVRHIPGNRRVPLRDQRLTVGQAHRLLLGTHETQGRENAAEFHRLLGVERRRSRASNNHQVVEVREQPLQPCHEALAPGCRQLVDPIE